MPLIVEARIQREDVPCRGGCVDPGRVVTCAEKRLAVAQGDGAGNTVDPRMKVDDSDRSSRSQSGVDRGSRVCCPGVVGAVSDRIRIRRRRPGSKHLSTCPLSQPPAIPDPSTAGTLLVAFWAKAGTPLVANLPMAVTPAAVPATPADVLRKPRRVSSSTSSLSLPRRGHEFAC